MLTLILLSTLMSLPWSRTSTDTINLQILYKEKIIGNFSAHRSEMGDLTVYRSNSTVIANVVRSRISYQIKVVLKNGILEQSDLKMIVNGKLRTHSQTKKDGEVYTFFKNGKPKGKVHDVISHTTIMLYFEEPLGIEKTYSEEEGDFCKILGTDPNTYHKINARGKINIYRYSGQQLSHLLIETTFMDFEMKTEMADKQVSTK